MVCLLLLLGGFDLGGVGNACSLLHQLTPLGDAVLTQSIKALKQDVSTHTCHHHSPCSTRREYLRPVDIACNECMAMALAMIMER